MAKGEYLLEVRAEEIPARMLAPAVKELGTRVFEELMARGLGPKEIESGFTPRRLWLVLRGLPEGEKDREERAMGPPASVAFDDDGTPTKAALGFAKRCGVAPEELERVETEKGEYLATTLRIEGQATADILAEAVPRILAGISWAKSMVWGDGAGPWARPIHGIVSVLAGKVVPFELFGVEAGDVSVGHPVLSPNSFRVKGAAEWRRKLTQRDVVVSPEERREKLWQGMTAAAKAAGGEPVRDDALLGKLAAICEIPGVLEGAFEEEYLELPREVLVASLRDHQSAFTVESDGELLPHFLTVMDRPDDEAGRVRAGNEWVVSARLADAQFFYSEDRKLTLSERASDLERLTFHVKLGSYAAKSERLVELATQIARDLGWEDDEEHARVAAGLLKVDLTTEMVKEFTSLEGVMGGLYAREDGLHESVWQAIYDHYLPSTADDPTPRGAGGLDRRARRPHRHPGRHLRPRPGADREP